MADVPLPTGLVAILRHPPTERIIRPKTRELKGNDLPLLHHWGPFGAPSAVARGRDRPCSSPNPAVIPSEVLKISYTSVVSQRAVLNAHVDR